MATILKGAPVAAARNERNTALCEQLKAKGVVPTLAVVRVGEREDDLSYERGVMTRCGKVGVEVKQCLLPVDAAQDDLLKVIAEVNADGAVHGDPVFHHNIQNACGEHPPHGAAFQDQSGFHMRHSFLSR